MCVLEITCWLETGCLERSLPKNFLFRLDTNPFTFSRINDSGFIRRIRFTTSWLIMSMEVKRIILWQSTDCIHNMLVQWLMCRLGSELATLDLLSLDPFLFPMAEYGWHGKPLPKMWIWPTDNGPQINQSVMIINRNKWLQSVLKTSFHQYNQPKELVGCKPISFRGHH